MTFGGKQCDPMIPFPRWKITNDLEKMNRQHPERVTDQMSVLFEICLSIYDLCACVVKGKYHRVHFTKEIVGPQSALIQHKVIALHVLHTRN